MFYCCAVVSIGVAAVVMGVSESIGDYGGAHMNPAISIAFAITLRITVTRGLYTELYHNILTRV